MDPVRRQALLKVSGAVLLVLATATAFAAYLRPDMLASFATAVMLCF